jgi:hypothetical protein
MSILTDNINIDINSESISYLPNVPISKMSQQFNKLITNPYFYEETKVLETGKFHSDEKLKVLNCACPQILIVDDFDFNSYSL